MSVVPGRIVCPRCGVNNFDTQAACWKCGAPLASSGGSAAPVVRSSPVVPSSPSASGSVVPSPASAAAASVVPTSGVDPAVANWSAVALAFLFPFIAVPVGLIFLMLDDRRKIELGKLTLVAGLIFSLLHFVVTGWMISGLIAQVRGLVPSLPGQSQPQQPQPNDPVPPLQFPGIPR